MKEITIIKPDDFHIHLRQGEDLKAYLKDSAKQFKRGIVMPNTIPPVVSVKDVEDYREFITALEPGFEPLMTFKILPNTNPNIIKELKDCGVLAGKYYPAGATTNSGDGLTDWTVMRPVLKEMERTGMILSIHGEVPDSFILDREKDFLPIIKDINREFPDLKIILEHVSSEAGINFIKSCPNNIAGTISLHHLLLTIEDVVNNINNKCMPIPKLPQDRLAIQKAAFSGEKKFFFGSDSAPHKRVDKITIKPKAGVYTAPVLLPKLVELFSNNGVLNLLENFTSKFGAEFYGLPINSETITLINKSMEVPEDINGVVPFLAGEKISWSLK
ncbi:dihydroorotase [Thiospirochaeta perfilievii]|uniref:Dihydroorotase n=1 Tax=Thiospirochaeta perfilievii TaxID=252967 RepID=A0A5C1QBQ3_9SPIO|nr:dihydroorotase [Thiospirochaeta perfilievii]QEN04947.1 dihydroorotase [Thiospirochaeta perfilievii]